MASIHSRPSWYQRTLRIFRKQSDRTMHMRGMEHLEPRYVLAYVPFSAEVILTKTDGPTRVDGADLDGDGDVDILATNPGWIGWFENVDGAGAFSSTGRTIASDLDDARVSIPVDIDGDGDLDVLNEETEKRISWYENIDGQGTFLSQGIIIEDDDGLSRVGSGMSIGFTDFDQDGDLDILMTSFGHWISWFENTDGRGQFAEPQILISKPPVYGMLLADVDTDGDDDIVTWGNRDENLQWYETLEGGNLSATPQPLSDMIIVGFPGERPGAADLDNDGDIDFVVETEKSRSTDELVWLENLGSGKFATPRTMDADSHVPPNGLSTVDLDGDGDQDVLVGRSVYLNMDGRGTFSERIRFETPSSLHPADVDGDGDQDFLHIEALTNKMSWLENLDGTRFGDGRFITENRPELTITHIRAADMDTDGDLDVLTVSAEDGRMAWHENLDGNGQFGGRRLITEDAETLNSLDVSDLDNDGDYDIVYSQSNFNSIVWLENEDAKGSFGLPKLVAAEAREISLVFAVDIDGDGDQDILSAFPGDHDICWFENTDREGTFGPCRTVGVSAHEVSFIHAGDVDRDGDLDVVSGSQSGQSITWFENSSGNGLFGGEQLIASQIEGLSSLVLADGDVDGDLDVVATVDRMSLEWIFKTAVWFENTDGRGQFQKGESLSLLGDEFIHVADLDGEGTLELIAIDPRGGPVAWRENAFGDSRFRMTKIHDQVISMAMADLNGDGNTDLIAGLGRGDSDTVVWYRNELVAPSQFVQEHRIDPDAIGAYRIVATDVDGDGDLDAITASRDNVAWYENLDGRGTFGPERVITRDTRGLFAGDFDGDGRSDLLFASGVDDMITVLKNLGGSGTFGEPIVIGQSDGAASVIGEDLDGDGDLDLLVSAWGKSTSQSTTYDRITWYENLDGQGGFGPERVIDPETETGEVRAADVDGDGDLDVLLKVFQQPGTLAGAVAWYENMDGNGNFGPRRDIAATDLRLTGAIMPADLDNDGDVDVIVGNVRDLLWFENLDGSGSFGRSQLITNEVTGVRSVGVADVDNDGDLDVVSASRQDDKLAWYENLDGLGSFGPQQVIARSEAPVYVFPTDLDQDDDIDLLAAFHDEDVFSWFENGANSRPHAGDANEDLVFNQLDIVQVLAAGKYLTGQGATWREGDWNEDGVFDQLDIVAALQSGKYVANG